MTWCKGLPARALYRPFFDSSSYSFSPTLSSSDGLSPSSSTNVHNDLLEFTSVLPILSAPEPILNSEFSAKISNGDISSDRQRDASFLRNSPRDGRSELYDRRTSRLRPKSNSGLWRSQMNTVRRVSVPTPTLLVLFQESVDLFQRISLPPRTSQRVADVGFCNCPALGYTFT